MNAGGDGFLVLHVSGAAAGNSPRHLGKPAWRKVEQALELAFEHGGNVVLEIESGADESFVKELCMQSLPGQYRIVALTRSTDRKKEVLEWWGDVGSSFKGVLRFGDDNWDARSVSSDIHVVKKMFSEFLESNDLVEGLGEMLSPWDRPK